MSGSGGMESSSGSCSPTTRPTSSSRPPRCSRPPAARTPRCATRRSPSCGSPRPRPASPSRRRRGQGHREARSPRAEIDAAVAADPGGARLAQGRGARPPGRQGRRRARRLAGRGPRRRTRRASQTSVGSYDGPPSGRAAVAVALRARPGRRALQLQRQPARLVGLLQAHRRRMGRCRRVAHRASPTRRRTRYAASPPASCAPATCCSTSAARTTSSMYIGGGRIVEAANPSKGVIVSERVEQLEPLALQLRGPSRRLTPRLPHPRAATRRLLPVDGHVDLAIGSRRHRQRTTRSACASRSSASYGIQTMRSSRRNQVS